MIKVLLVEDQGLVRGALRALLDLEKDINVVAEASDGLEARQILDTNEIDVVVSDIEMPKLSGIELAEYILQAQLEVKTVIVTTLGAPATFGVRSMQVSWHFY